MIRYEEYTQSSGPFRGKPFVRSVTENINEMDWRYTKLIGSLDTCGVDEAKIKASGWRSRPLHTQEYERNYADGQTDFSASSGSQPKGVNRSRGSSEKFCDDLNSGRLALAETVAHTLGYGCIDNAVKHMYRLPLNTVGDIKTDITTLLLRDVHLKILYH